MFTAGVPEIVAEEPGPPSINPKPGSKSHDSVDPVAPPP